ncbi:MAG: RES family NAD+ phosphorylase [bacterium]
MAQAYRIVNHKWRTSAFDGEGARIHGGRWNHPGVSCVYLASSRALAALELLVHLTPKTQSIRFTFLEVSLESMSIEKIATLPVGWNDALPSGATREIGTEWLRSKRSPVLQVPSVLIPDEPNYLLNPRHPDCENFFPVRARDFFFDPRLRKHLGNAYG